MRKVTTNHIDKAYLYDKDLTRSTRKAVGTDEGWLSICIKNNTKDGKRHFTKEKVRCKGCDTLLDIRDYYHKYYGFCGMVCGLGLRNVKSSDSF